METEPRVAEAPAPLPEQAPAEEHPFGKPPKDLPAIEPGPPTRMTDSAGVSVRPLDLRSAKERALFLNVVDGIYAGDPNYIKPLAFERMKFLDPAKSPAFHALDAQAFVVQKGGRTVGRITAHIDRAYDRYHGTRAGWFGFFECINDRRAAHALLAEACRWLAERGAREVIGPSNFTTNHQTGLLVENFDRPPVIEMTYNPRYYEELITSFGFGKAKDLLAWWIDVSQGTDNKKVARIAKICEKVRQRDGVTIRTADIKRFDEEVALLFGIYNEAWQKNWGYVPVAQPEFEQTAKDLKAIVQPELVLFVEVRGQPVAFSVTLPDVNTVMPRNGKLLPFGWFKLFTGLKKIKQGRLMALGVVPGARKRGLESMLFIETLLRAHALGWSGGEIGWTLEDNDAINRAIQSMDGKLDRRYRLFGLRLSA